MLTLLLALPVALAATPLLQTPAPTGQEPAPVEPPVEAQEPSAETPVATQEPAPETPAAQDGKARALLRELAAAQAPGQPDQQVAGFRMEIVLRDFADDGTREVGLLVRYRRLPEETVELVVDENGVRVRKGFDGDSYWLQEDGMEQRVDLGGHEFEQDRESIDQVLDLCADLLLLLDAEQLERRCEELALGAAGADGTDRRLSGTLSAASGAWEFALFLPPEVLEPRAFWLFHRVEVAEGEQPPEDPFTDVQRFELLGWKEFGGRRAPQLIRVYDTLRSVDPDSGEEVLERRALELQDVRWDLVPRTDKGAPRD